MVGLRFRGDRVLPRRGVVRVQNGDGVPHFALAFPLRPGVTTKQFGRVLRSNSERAFGRISAGAPYGLQAIRRSGSPGPGGMGSSASSASTTGSGCAGWSW